MNKYIKIFLTTVITLCTTFSCDRDEVYTREQYKHVFSIVSGTDNVSMWVHDLRIRESIGYISASLGGTKPSKQDVVITVVEDNKLIDEFNYVNFSSNPSRFIQPLSADRYSIDNYQFTIPAGQISGELPIRIRPEGLSPDSSYFIALKVDYYSAYEVVPEYDFILYEVRTKNWWANSRGTTYSLMGTFQDQNMFTTTVDDDGNEIQVLIQPVAIVGSKPLFPVSENVVRLVAGTETRDALGIFSETDFINMTALLVTIVENDKVVITPYKNLDVRQVDDDPEFPNTVQIYNDGFRTYKQFLLSYIYTGLNGREIHIREELRLEFLEDVKDPRYL